MLAKTIMNDLRLHHIGFVVRSIEAAAPDFIGSLGAAWDEVIYHDPLQKVRVTFLQPGTGAAIELVEPAGADSPVVRFLEMTGGGLHHLCYETPDMEETIRQLRKQGVLKVRSPLPAVAFQGRRIAWLLTRQKLLLELLALT